MVSKLINKSCNLIILAGMVLLIFLLGIIAGTYLITRNNSLTYFLHFHRSSIIISTGTGIISGIISTVIFYLYQKKAEAKLFIWEFTVELGRISKSIDLFLEYNKEEWISDLSYDNKLNRDYENFKNIIRIFINSEINKLIEETLEVLTEVKQSYGRVSEHKKYIETQGKQLKPNDKSGNNEWLKNDIDKKNKEIELYTDKMKKSKVIIRDKSHEIYMAPK